MKKFQDENMGAKSEPGTARLYHITSQIARQSYFKERMRNEKLEIVVSAARKILKSEKEKAW